jgi:hypothetical protein
MVDPPEEGVLSYMMLLEWLHESPQKITSYISKNH